MAKRRGRKTVKQAEKDSMKQTQIKNENVLPLDQEGKIFGIHILFIVPFHTMNICIVVLLYGEVQVDTF